VGWSACVKVSLCTAEPLSKFVMKAKLTLKSPDRCHATRWMFGTDCTFPLFEFHLPLRALKTVMQLIRIVFMQNVHYDVVMDVDVIVVAVVVVVVAVVDVDDFVAYQVAIKLSIVVKH